MAAVDGKALRRSFETASERSPTHLLQAFAAEAKLTLAQVVVDGKSNEIPALPELLELLDVKGRTVTADAMHAQRGSAAAIVAKGGDYALQLKRNQGTMYADVVEYLDNPPKSAELLSHQQVDKGHGRVETRTATVCHDVVRPAQVRPRPAQRRRPARHDPRHPQARVGGKSICDCPEADRTRG